MKFLIESISVEEVINKAINSYLTDLFSIMNFIPAEKIDFDLIHDPIFDSLSKQGLSITSDDIIIYGCKEAGLIFKDVPLLGKSLCKPRAVITRNNLLDAGFTLEEIEEEQDAIKKFNTSVLTKGE